MEKSGSGRGVMRWEGSEAQAGLTGCTNAEEPLRLQRRRWGGGGSVRSERWPRTLAFLFFLKNCETLSRGVMHLNHCRNFRGGPVVKALGSRCRGPRFHPWSGS